MREMETMEANTPIRRFKHFVRTKSGAGVVRKLSVLWGLLALGAGVIIPAFARPHEASQTFHTTFMVVDPMFWGLAFLILGAFVLITLASGRVDLTSYLLFILGVVICVMAFTTSGTFFSGPGENFGRGGAPLVTWVLVVLAAAIMIVGSAVDVPEQKERR